MTPSMTRSFPRVLLGRFAVALAVSLPLVLGGVVFVNAFLDRKIDEIPRVKAKTAENTTPGQQPTLHPKATDTPATEQTLVDSAAPRHPATYARHRWHTVMALH